MTIPISVDIGTACGPSIPGVDPCPPSAHSPNSAVMVIVGLVLIGLYIAGSVQRRRALANVPRCVDCSRIARYERPVEMYHDDLVVELVCGRHRHG